MLDFENHSRGGHGLQSVGGLFVYENRKHVYKLSQQVLEELTDIDPGIKALQQHSIVDKDHQYPVMLDLDFDIDTWQDAQHKYIVIPVASLTEEFDFYMNRRKGLLKNKIKLINNKI
jgi:hypothetical protein